VYVYGVVRADAEPRLPDTGIDGRPVGRLAEGEVAAVVGDAAEGPVRASRRNLMAHSRVLQSVLETPCDVLPMRFGVVMPDAAALRDELLVAHAAELAAQLDVVSGKVELDVTVSCPEEAILRAVVAGNRQLADAARQAAGHHQRIAAGEAIAAGVADYREAVAARALEELGPFATDAVADEPHTDEELLRAAFLVERGRIDGVDAALERLGAALGDEARVRSVGPVPPYHFVDLALQERAWA